MVELFVLECGEVVVVLMVPLSLVRCWEFYILATSKVAVCIYDFKVLPHMETNKIQDLISY